METERLLMKMLSIQRREAIRALLLEKESITIAEVMEKFQISVETARRDFDALADEGFLNKVYGGATLKKRTSALPPKKLLDSTFSEGKTRIAKRAVRFIKSGDTIFLDNSDTVFHMCEGLENMNITVLTNSLAVINCLSKSSSIHLICVGGRYDISEESFLGPTASEYLRRFQVDRAFFSCKSFDMARGLGVSDERVADMKKTIIQCAEQRCLLADHSKFGKVSFAHFCDFDEIDNLFTDEVVSDEWHDYFDRPNVRLFECPESGEIQPEENFY